MLERVGFGRPESWFGGFARVPRNWPQNFMAADTTRGTGGTARPAPVRQG
jgi:hypothetical protein